MMARRIVQARAGTADIASIVQMLEYAKTELEGYSVIAAFCLGMAIDDLRRKGLDRDRTHLQ